jgi:hypothetical protein
MSAFGRWLGYDVETAAAAALVPQDRGEVVGPFEPLYDQTEAEIREAEKRYNEDARRLAAEAEAERIAHHRPPIHWVRLILRRLWVRCFGGHGGLHRGRP